MRLAHTLVLASLLAAPAMAADVVVTTPGVVAPVPGVVVAPGAGNEARDLNQAERHEEKAARALENGNYGTAARQENKADRALDKAERPGAVVIER